MQEPTRCASPACGAWTFRADGYCSDECASPPPRRTPTLRRPRVRLGLYEETARATGANGWIRWNLDVERYAKGK